MLDRVQQQTDWMLQLLGSDMDQQPEVSIVDLADIVREPVLGDADGRFLSCAHPAEARRLRPGRPRRPQTRRLEPVGQRQESGGRRGVRSRSASGNADGKPCWRSRTAARASVS